VSNRDLQLQRHHHHQLQKMASTTKFHPKQMSAMHRTHMATVTTLVSRPHRP
jgi:hypothetical protein